MIVELNDSLKLFLDFYNLILHYWLGNKIDLYFLFKYFDLGLEFWILSISLYCFWLKISIFIILIEREWKYSSVKLFTV